MAKTLIIEEYQPVAQKPVFRISHLGNCRKALGADALGMRDAREEEELFDPANPDSDEGIVAAQEGHRHEAHVKDDLVNRYGVRLVDDQAVIGEEFDDFQIVGHIDGVIIDKDKNLFKSKRPHLLEVKALKEYRYDWIASSGLSQFEGYQLQISMYMYYTGLPVYYVYKNRNTGRWSWFRLKKGDYPVEPTDVIKRLKKITRSAAREKLLKCDDPSAWVFCPYKNRGLCSWFRDREKAQIMEDDNLYVTLTELIVVDANLKTVQSKRDGIRNLLREFGKDGDARIQVVSPTGYGKPFYVNLQTQGRKGWNTNAMIETLIAEGYPEDEFRTESSSQYLRITGGGSDK